MNEAHDSEARTEDGKWSLGSIVIWVGYIVLAGALAFVAWVVIPLMEVERMDAEQISMKWVEGNIDALEQEMVDYVTGNDWDMRDLGEGVVGALMRENMVLQYGVLGEVGEGVAQVRALASGNFTGQTAAGARQVNAYLPLLVNIQLAEQKVLDWEVDLFGASLSAGESPVKGLEDSG